jgi:hypothetical protein
MEREEAIRGLESLSVTELKNRLSIIGADMLCFDKFLLIERINVCIQGTYSLVIFFLQIFIFKNNSNFHLYFFNSLETFFNHKRCCILFDFGF